jgi:hypothetical protein
MLPLRVNAASSRDLLTAGIRALRERRVGWRGGLTECRISSKAVVVGCRPGLDLCVIEGDETPLVQIRGAVSTYTGFVWARPDATVARLPLFVLFLLCAGFPPVAAAAVPSWQGERPLPQAFGGGARVAVTSAGDVAVAWQDVEKGLSVAVRSAGGRFGPPQRLSGSGRWVKGLDVVADSRGALIVVWADTECCRIPADTRVWVSTREPGGQFSQPVALSRGFDGFYIRAPAVAAGDDGSLTVAWPVDNSGTFEGVPQAVIEVADRLPGGGFSAARQVSQADVRPYEPRIARGPSGETVVLWNTESCPPFPCSQELFASTRAPGGQFGAPERVAVAAGSGTFPGWVQAADVQIASDGTVVALWREGLLCMYCSGADVKAARRQPGQQFESPQTLGHLGGAGPWLALDAADTALALWGDANTDRDALGRNPRVFGAEAPPHEAFVPSGPLDRGDALGIASGGGQAIAAWTRNGKVVAAVHRQGVYCRQSISRRPAKSDGDVAANRRGDAVAVWSPAEHPDNVIVALGPADGRSPVIKRLSVRLGDFGAARARGARGQLRPRFRFTLSEAAEVRISIERRAEGRFRPVRSLVRSMPAGKNHVTYTRSARGLRPGRYRALISARDCAGRRSRSPVLPFVVSG